MMWALVQNGRFGQAIGLFRTKQILGFEPTADDLSCLVSACTQLGALLLGKVIHGYLIRHELSAEFETKTIETSILNMYSKCGSIILARRCFGTMAYRDTMAWSSMIEGYAVHGIGLKALDMFIQMQDAGIRPSSVTFLSLLSCCSHSGFVSEGCQVFTLMTVKFRIKPEINHYTCMVDLLARDGKLTDALNFVHSMNAKQDGRIWGALLASCRVHQNVKSKGVTMTVLLAKAGAMELAHHPVVNATCKDGKNFTYNSCINIAVVVAIDGGLITPVLQDADKTSSTLFHIYKVQFSQKRMLIRGKQLSVLFLANISLVITEKAPFLKKDWTTYGTHPIFAHISYLTGMQRLSSEVEHVIREEKTMSAYELIEIYYELIVACLPIAESQKFQFHVT